MLIIIYRDYPAWGKMKGRQAQILQRHVVRVTSVDVGKSQSYLRSSSSLRDARISTS
jgi:hypothetical protein